MATRTRMWWMAGGAAGLLCAAAGFAVGQDGGSKDQGAAAPESGNVVADAPAGDDSAGTSAKMAEDMAESAFAAPVYRADGYGDGSPTVRASLLAEGSFLSECQGILVPVGERDWGFVFDPDASGHAERPMFLQPCLRLAEMVRLRASRNRTATFIMSGRVMIHHGVNVIMPEEARLVPTDDLGAETASEADRMIEANRVLDPNGGEPSIDDLLARIEAARGDDQRGLAGSELDDAAAQARGDLVPEGTLVVSMRGRVVRSASGMLAFVREGDQGPLSPGVGELVFLRCRNLEAIEQLWQRGGDRFSLTVSGPVTVFEGSNYVLPLMYVVDSRRGGEITSAQ